MFEPDKIIVNTLFEYYDHMILKVWDSYIQQQGLSYFYQRGKDADTETVNSLFTGQSQMLFSRIAGIIINAQGLYINAAGQSISVCGAVDYLNNLAQTQHNAITGAIEIAWMQIQQWNGNHNNKKIEHHVVVFPYHAHANHWNLGILELLFDKSGALKQCQLIIKEPLYKQKTINEAVIKSLQKIIPIEIKFQAEATEQQSDSTSCGVISAENGKDIIEGKRNRLTVKYTSGAKDLRLQHIEEVKNCRFSEIQHNNERYADPQVMFNAPWEKIKNAFIHLQKQVKDKQQQEEALKELLVFFQNADKKIDPYKSFERSKTRIFHVLKDDLVLIEVATNKTLFSLLFKNELFEYQDNAIDTLHRFANEAKEQPKIKQGQLSNSKVVNSQPTETVTQKLSSSPITEVDDIEEQFSEEEKVGSAQRSLKELCQLLKNKYRENPYIYIERLFYPDYPLSLKQCYLHLALIEEKQIMKDKTTDEQGMPKQQEKNKEENTPQRENFLREYERIEHIKRKLEVRDLLAECKEKPRRIYIEGAAGAGKSTLSRYIVHQWSLGEEHWKSYHWVFHVRLREITENSYSEKNTELIKVLERECFKLGHDTSLNKEEKESLEKNMRQNPQQVLLVLDGVDELQLTTNYVIEVWQSLINSNYDLLFTSRPGAQLIKKDLNINFNLSVLGFSDEQIEQYIRNFFDPLNTPNTKTEDAQNFLDILKNSPNLWSLAHTPIQLELLCSIWGEELRKQELNLTNLYCLILEKLLKRYEQLQLKQEGHSFNLDDIDINPLKNKYQQQLLYMEYLAFKGMEDKDIVLSEKHINKAYKKLPKSSLTAIEFYKQLKGLGLIKRYNNGKQAEFVHLTFQEFFAARYIARSIKGFCEEEVKGLSHEALLEFIKHKKWDQFYEVMWSFVAGLLAGKNSQKQELVRYQYQDNEDREIKTPKSHLRLQRLQTLFDLLLQEPRHAVRYEEILLLARCLDEAKMPEIMQKEAISKQLFCYYSYYIKTYSNFSIPQFARIDSFIKLNHRYVKHNRGLFEKFLLERLRILDLNFVKNPSYIDLIKIFPENAIPLLPYYVCMNGVEILIQLGTPLLEQVIRAFVDAFEDQKNSVNVRTLAAIALEKLENKLQEVAYPISGEVLKYLKLHKYYEIALLALLEPLKDQEDSVRINAALKLGGHLKRIPKTVIPLLLKVLKDPALYVRWEFVRALKDVEISASENVIFVLLEAFKDQDDHVRREASYVLKKFSKQILESDIPTILEALKDPNLVVRINIADVLEEVEIPEPNNVITVLLEAIKVQDETVRRTAAKVLRRFGKQITKSHIPTMLEVLNDPDWLVRSMVADALGEVEIPEPNNVITVLLEAIKVQDETVRRTAAKALTKIGKQIPETHLPALLEALKDPDLEVRINVADILGEVEITNPETVISVLLEKIIDQNIDIGRREVAIRAVVNVKTPALEKILISLRKVIKEDKEMRRMAVRALGKLGKRIPETVIPILLEILKDKEDYVWVDVVEVLINISKPATEEVVSALLEVSNAKEAYIRLTVVRALKELGTQFPNKVILVLIEFLSDEDKRIRKATVEVLYNISRVSPEKINFFFRAITK